MNHTGKTGRMYSHKVAEPEISIDGATGWISGDIAINNTRAANFAGKAATMAEIMQYLPFISEFKKEIPKGQYAIVRFNAGGYGITSFFGAMAGDGKDWKVVKTYRD